MHYAFLSLAILLSQDNIRVLKKEDLKSNQVIARTTEDSDLIPDIIDEDFMSEKEIVQEAPDEKTAKDELEIKEEDFAEIKTEEELKEEEKKKPETIVEKITDKTKEVVDKAKETVTEEKKEEKEEVKSDIIVLSDVEQEKDSKGKSEVTEKEEDAGEVGAQISSEKVEEKVQKSDATKEEKIPMIKSPETEKMTNLQQLSPTEEEYKEEQEYIDYLTEEEKLDLKLEEKEQIDIPVVYPKKKKSYGFTNEDVPEELMSNERSKDNRHIPTVIKHSDVQNMAQKAIEDNDIEKLRAIVRELRDPNLKLNNNRTVLNYATYLKRYNIMYYLLHSGADPNLEAPIHIAVNKNDTKALEMLLERNANPDLKDSLYKTPLMIAIEKGYNTAALILIDYNADVTIANRNGETALGTAIRYQRHLVKDAILNK